MPESAIINSSPLILLAKIGYLNLLREGYRALFVPDAVIDEINRGGMPESLMVATGDRGWIQVVKVSNIPPTISAWDLGEGESSVLAWAVDHPRTIAVMDDREGRRCAASLGLTVQGCLGLVLAAKKTGRISQARPILLNMREKGLYLSDRVLNMSLGLVGE